MKSFPEENCPGCVYAIEGAITGNSWQPCCTNPKALKYSDNLTKCLSRKAISQ